MDRIYFQLRRALPEEAGTLGALAMRSKSLWGYSAEFMDACRAELSPTPQFLEKNSTVVAESKNQIAGFYTLVELTTQDVELWFLFVDPTFVGRGCGTVLLDDAIARARNHFYKSMIIQADPNAVDFYLKAGAEETGIRESESLPARQLPLLKIDLNNRKETIQK